MIVKMNQDVNHQRLTELLQKEQNELGYNIYQRKETGSFALMNDQQYLGGIIGHIKDDICHIELLAVDASCRGKGYGKQLLQAIEAWAWEHDCTKMTITTLHFQALEFYKHFGYQIFGMLEDSPKKGVDKYYLYKNRP